MGVFMAYKTKDYHKQYYLKHKIEYAKRSQQYYILNRDQLLEKAGESDRLEKNKNRNKEKKYRYVEYQKEYKIKNAENLKVYIKLYNNNRRSTDINFRLKDNLRRRINNALKKNSRNEATVKLLGCSIEFLKIHLQQQFKQGMTWRNYGEWEIDHIIPCSKFNLTDIYQQQQCFNYRNLQPLWKIENIKKFNHIINTQLKLTI